MRAVLLFARSLFPERRGAAGPPSRGARGARLGARPAADGPRGGPSAARETTESTFSSAREARHKRRAVRSIFGSMKFHTSKTTPKFSQS